MKCMPTKLMVRHCGFEASKEKTYSHKIFSRSYEIQILLNEMLRTVDIYSILWIIVGCSCINS